MENTGIGASVARREDLRLLTGAGRYTDDIRADRQVHAVFVRSSHAHADVLGIDIEPALALRGVVAGYGEYMKNDYVTTSVSEDSKLLVSYLSQRQTLVADLSKLHGGTKTARWFDPRNGQYRDVPNIGPNALNQFTPPSNEDWVLLVKSE